VDGLARLVQGLVAGEQQTKVSRNGNRSLQAIAARGRLGFNDELVIALRFGRDVKVEGETPAGG